jgi:hypothetical protein
MSCTRNGSQLAIRVVVRTLSRTSKHLACCLIQLTKLHLAIIRQWRYWSTSTIVHEVVSTVETIAAEGVWLGKGVLRCRTHTRSPCHPVTRGLNLAEGNRPRSDCLLPQRSMKLSVRCRRQWHGGRTSDRDFASSRASCDLLRQSLGVFHRADPEAPRGAAFSPLHACVRVRL